MIGSTNMWHLDTEKLLRWIGSIGAKLLLVAFLTPFTIMGAAVAYGIAGSQLGEQFGIIAAIGFVIGVSVLLHYWVGMIPRRGPPEI